jgi:hypothetical protein
MLSVPIVGPLRTIPQREAGTLCNGSGNVGTIALAYGIDEYIHQPSHAVKEYIHPSKLGAPSSLVYER